MKRISWLLATYKNATTFVKAWFGHKKSIHIEKKYLYVFLLAAQGLSACSRCAAMRFWQKRFGGASYRSLAKPRQKSHANTPSYRYNPRRIVLRSKRFKHSYKSFYIFTCSYFAD